MGVSDVRDVRILRAAAERIDRMFNDYDRSC